MTYQGLSCQFNTKAAPRSLFRNKRFMFDEMKDLKTCFLYQVYLYIQITLCSLHFSFCATRKEKCIFPSSINLLFLKSEKELHSTDHEFSMPSSGNHASTGSQMVLYLWFHYYWLLDSHVNNNHVRYSKENTSKVKLFSFG